MPIYEIEDDNGNVLELEGDSPPTEQELEQIFAQFQRPPAGPIEAPAQTALPPVVAEGAAALNRGVASIPDFFIDAANAIPSVRKAAGTILEPLTGGRDAIPRVQDALENATGFGQRNFMEPGLARTVVQEGGEFVGGLGAPTTAGVKVASEVTQELADQAAVQAARTAGSIRVGDKATAGVKVDATGEIVKDKSLSKAAAQGFDEGILASLKAGTPEDKKKLTQILNIRERGLRNARAGVVDRASDVVGRSIQQRLNVVVSANRDAGARINAAAKKLRGRLDFDATTRLFDARLGEAGISRGEKGLDFSGSQFEDLAESERLLNVIARRLNRLRETGDPKVAHDLKRYIDENVSYGKSQGLTGDAERIVKELRAGIDGTLDAAFDNYRIANEDYAATIQVIDDLQSAAGKKIDLSGVNAEKALGTLARTVMSNNRGRQELLNVLDDLQETARQYGSQSKDDILLQALFVDELDNVFKPAARTSLAGDVAKSATDAGVEVVAGDGSGLIRQGARVIGEKVLNRNEEAALKAIREFLAQ